MKKSRNSDRIVFGMIGSGWRAEFYLRIASLLPDRFMVCGAVNENEINGKEFEKKWGIKSFTSIDELVDNTDPEFVVAAVPWDKTPVMIAELTARGVPALSETPPAPDLSSLIALNELVGKGAKIQVSEQYHMHPLHASRLSLVEKGLIGDVNHMQISACHGYHAISLIRKFLGLGYENAVISARSITTSLTAGPDRFGIPRQEKLIDSLQVIAMLEFGDKVVLYDFSDDQYFSWIRSNRFLVRGNKGEISNNTIRYLKDFRTPVEIELKRQNAGEYGNLEGYYLKGILAGDEWIYTNPLIPGRLTDDEIGVASCLLKMNRFVREGVSFYSLEEASQDHYLSMMIDKAANTGNKIQTESQIWSF